ncbi:CoA-transferase [Enhydrobacter aerosaccus]|uniref:CoA-transferase n=1 Tax=Enhydrobacter aerosaccus TaxID=225324 RepID=A0ABR5IIV1_9HYPH|nr:CaiB/BaiF CoA-transferase family protein [Enhydrobacter aerosaccus]KND16765.1 CoA-transferase [Enhydrobacter aerosaccus]
MSSLKGIRVLDLSRVLAGPWCSQMLGDLGAEVIKIERPKTGDDTRTWGPPWMKDDEGEQTKESAYYQSANRNKLSVAVDISKPEGQLLLKELVKQSDVLIENYKTGSLEKYGLDYQSLKKINPRLVYCSITGFGQTGPRAQEPGYDFIVQGMAGLMSITGERDDLVGGGPQKVGIAVADLFTGMYSAVAILAALLNRENHTGEGQYIDMALLDVQVAVLASQGMNYLASNIVPKRYGNAHVNIVPYQVFSARDQDFIIACGNDSQFLALCKAIGLPDLPFDSRFIKNSDRVQNRDALDQILSKHFLTDNAKKWVDVINQSQVPVGLINNVKQAFEEPQVIARDMLVSISHPLKEKLKVIGSPIKMSDTPVQYHKAPPLLGEDTDKVLRKIISEEQLDQLKKLGIVQQYH